MLSPNARNFVADSRGGPRTRTVKLHVTASCSASVTVQMTVVVPMAKAPPDPGAQLNDSGCTPPAACGLAKSMRIGSPVSDCDTTGAGHVIAGCGDSPGALGSIGDAARTQPAAARAASAAAAASARNRKVRTF